MSKLSGKCFVFITKYELLHERMLYEKQAYFSEENSCYKIFCYD